MTSLFKTWNAERDQQPPEAESTAEAASQTEAESSRSSFSLLEAQEPAPWPPREELEDEVSEEAALPPNRRRCELPPAPNPDRYQIVILQVCDRRFTTTVNTLIRGSKFFAAFFYHPRDYDNDFGGYEHPSVVPNMPYPSKPFMQLQEDGSYFLDANPDHFAHILNYLRLEQYPIFYSKNAGHDYGAYFSILLEARRFQIRPLFQWIRYAQYNHCVTTRRDVYMETVSGEAGRHYRSTYNSNQDEEVHSKWTTERVYVCPRGIEVHKGRPDFCGRACENSRQCGDGDSYERRPVVKNVVIRTATDFMPLDSDRLLAN